MKNLFNSLGYIKVFILLILLIATHSLQAQWVQTSLSDKDIRCFAVSGTNIFTGTEVGGVFLSTNNGIDWTQVNNGLNASDRHRSLTVSGPNIIVGSISSGVFLSTNNGTDWTKIFPEWDGSVLALTSDGVNIFAGTGNRGIYLTTDDGANWTQINTGLDTNFAIRSLLVSGTNIFAGTEGNGLFLSTNNGGNWVQCNLGLSGLEVDALALNGTSIFAGTYGSGGVFLSTNNGTNWTLVNNGLIPFVRSLAVSGSNIFAGTGGGGVYLSTDSGQNWTQVGMISTFIRALTVDGTTIFAGTSTSGVWKRPIDEMITSVETFLKDLPMNFLLNQNYPNPFNPSTKISWQSPIGSWQTLKVYDILGNEVATLVDEYKPAGNYNVEFRIENVELSSGIYFYQLKAESYIQTKKMILMK